MREFSDLLWLALWRELKSTQLIYQRVRLNRNRIFEVMFGFLLISHHYAGLDREETPVRRFTLCNCSVIASIPCFKASESVRFNKIN